MSIADATVRWSVVRAYYRRYGHARASIEGYEQFLGELVPAIIEEATNIRVASVRRRVDHVVEFSAVTIFPPSHKEDDGRVSKITPHEARTRKLTYAVPVATNVTQVIRKYAEVMGVQAACTRARAGLEAPHNVAVVVGLVAPDRGALLSSEDDDSRLAVAGRLAGFEPGTEVVLLARLVPTEDGPAATGSSPSTPRTRTRGGRSGRSWCPRPSSCARRTGAPRSPCSRYR